MRKLHIKLICCILRISLSSVEIKCTLYTKIVIFLLLRTKKLHFVETTGTTSWLQENQPTCTQCTSCFVQVPLLNNVEYNIFSFVIIIFSSLDFLGFYTSTSLQIYLYKLYSFSESDGQVLPQWAHNIKRPFQLLDHFIKEGKHMKVKSSFKEQDHYSKF